MHGPGATAGTKQRRYPGSWNCGTWTMHYRAKLMPRLEGGVTVPLSVSLSFELYVSLRGL
jgi:hypothetical protein